MDYKKCISCGEQLKDYNPEYCCNGQDCGCRGVPINAPVCEKALCWWELMGIKSATIYITHLEGQIEQLKEENLFLEALIQSGVDNWEGYGDALDLVEEWKESE